MPEGNRPTHRICLSNKDKSLRTFTNYKGDEVDEKYEEVAVLFENQYGGYDLSAKKKFTFDPAKHYCSVFAIKGAAKKRDEQGDDGEAEEQPRRRAARSTRKQESDGDGLDF